MNDRCPSCGTIGKRVKAVTVPSLVAAKIIIDTSLRYRFCRAHDCDVVYFSEQGEMTFTTSVVKVPVFQKSQSDDCPVCYCFDHSVASVRRAVQQSGASTLVEEIADKCRQGLDRCPETNPQGSCCLGNVRKVIAEAGKSEPPPVDCCDRPSSPSSELQAPIPKPSRVGLWSAAGALLAAIASSACCWLPLLLLGAGVSATGAAAFFESYRWLFVGVAVVLLAVGFYLVYFRAVRCAPGEARAVDRPPLHRFNKAVLWIATAMIAGFVAFPEFLVLRSPESLPIVTAHATSRSYAVIGMTCAGCANHVVEALQRVPGVAAADVSYRTRRAVVTFSQPIEDRAIFAAIKSLGYSAKRSDPRMTERW